MTAHSALCEDFWGNSAQNAAGRGAAPAPGTARPKILIVEDEAIFAEDMREMLEQSGYAVCSIFSSGEEAVAGFPALRPDLVLMDIGLGDGIDGIEAAAAITSQFPVPVVFLTAYHDTATLARAKVIHPYGYLVKPLEKTTVHTTLQVALAKNQHDNRIHEVSAWLDLTLENLDRGIVTLDRKGNIILMNSCAQRLAGWTPDNAYRVPLDDVLRFHDTDSNQPFIPFIPGVLTEGLVMTFPSGTSLVSKTGELHRVRDCSLSSIPDTDGSVLGAILVFTPEFSPEILGQPTGVPSHGDFCERVQPVQATPEIARRTVRIHDIKKTISTDHTLERATLCTLLGKFEVAESIYASLLEEDPGNFQAWHNRGNVLVKLGRHREALQAFSRALEICPDSAESQRRKADVLAIMSMKKTRD
jgi:AmiR/NasT family two-component response regulator